MVSRTKTENKSNNIASYPVIQKKGPKFLPNVVQHWALIPSYREPLFEQDVTHSLTQPKGPFQPQEHETSSESSINQTSPAVCRSNGEAARQKANVDQSYRICCHSANLLHGFKLQIHSADSLQSFTGPTRSRIRDEGESFPQTMARAQTPDDRYVKPHRNGGDQPEHRCQSQSDLLIPDACAGDKVIFSDLTLDVKDPSKLTKEVLPSGLIVCCQRHTLQLTLPQVSFVMRLTAVSKTMPEFQNGNWCNSRHRRGGGEDLKELQDVQDVYKGGKPYGQKNDKMRPPKFSPTKMQVAELCSGEAGMKRLGENYTESFSSTRREVESQNFKRLFEKT
ncbi:hypothetical protein F2P81_017345, partial [Scophthalmus maximus]